MKSDPKRLQKTAKFSILSSSFFSWEEWCSDMLYGLWGLSLVGRASDLHSEGQEFDSPSLHD